jgi:hypothetical protein
VAATKTWAISSNPIRGCQENLLLLRDKQAEPFVNADSELFLIWTESSVYEVDERAKRIRRTMGLDPPTDRVGIGWKTFEAVRAEIGLPAEILWRITPDGVCKMTITSNVVAIESKSQQWRDQ